MPADAPATDLNLVGKAGRAHVGTVVRSRGRMGPGEVRHTGVQSRKGFLGARGAQGSWVLMAGRIQTRVEGRGRRALSKSLQQERARLA